MENKAKIRNSNIELLKLIAIFLIIISHNLPFNYLLRGNEYLNLNLASNNYNNALLQFFRYLGQVGNVLFIICSSWFLTEKKEIKIEKICLIILNSFFISIISLTLFEICGFDIKKNMIIKQFFPIIFANNWFIGTYLLFYILTPFINLTLQKLNKTQIFDLVIFLNVFRFIELIKQNNYIFNELFAFIIIYVIVYYIKNYKNDFLMNIKKSRVNLIVNLILLFLMIIILNFAGLRIGSLNDKVLYFANIKNLIIIMIGISLFCIFYNKKTRYSKIVNFFASETLLIYLIHDNFLIREIIRPLGFKWILINIGYKNLPLTCIASSFIIFIICILIATVYKVFIETLLIKLIDKILPIIKNKYYTFRERYE